MLRKTIAYPLQYYRGGSATRGGTPSILYMFRCSWSSVCHLWSPIHKNWFNCLSLSLANKFFNNDTICFILYLTKNIAYINLFTKRKTFCLTRLVMHIFSMFSALWSVGSSAKLQTKCQTAWPNLNSIPCLVLCDCEGLLSNPWDCRYCNIDLLKIQPLLWRLLTLLLG